MTLSRRKFCLAAGVPLAMLAVVGCSSTDVPPDASTAATASASVDRLLLLDKDTLVADPPAEVVSGQSIWTMHETEKSRSTLVRIDSLTEPTSHQARRMLVVLDGTVDVNSVGNETRVTDGGYIDIPAGVEYSLAPVGGAAPTVVGFEVPRIDFTAGASSSSTSGPEAAQPVIRNLADMMADPPGWDDPSDRGWTLAKTPELRVNLVEMRTELKNHLHPDADHSLILLSGKARVVTPYEERSLNVGSYVSIPAGLPHKYFVDGDEPAMFVSFDAPAYDPAKTEYLE